MPYFLYNPVPIALLLGILLALYRYLRVTLPEERKNAEWMFIAWIAMIPLMIAANLFLGWATSFRSVKLDAYAFYLDGWMGFQPSVLLARWVWVHKWALWLLMSIYNSLAIMMSATIMTYLWLRPRDAARATALIAVTFVAATPIYLLLPICGPQFAFPGFPENVGPVVLKGMAIDAPPNCLPSVHFGMALLLARLLWPWQVGRIVGVSFAILTFLATLGLGEHYLIDLYAAVLYTQAICWAVGKWFQPVATPSLSAEMAANTSILPLSTSWRRNRKSRSRYPGAAW